MLNLRKNGKSLLDESVLPNYPQATPLSHPLIVAEQPRCQDNYLELWSGVRRSRKDGSKSAVAGKPYFSPSQALLPTDPAAAGYGWSHLVLALHAGWATQEPQGCQRQPDLHSFPSALQAGELRAERYLKDRAAGEIRKGETERGQKREESKRGKQLVVMASLQPEITRTTYISDPYVNCRWERHNKEPAVDLMSWVIYIKAQERHISVWNPATLKRGNTSARAFQWHIHISVPFWSALTFSRR